MKNTMKKVLAVVLTLMMVVAIVPMTFAATDVKATADASSYAESFSIRTPTISKVRYGDTIVLHADFDGELPEGAYVKWTADNENFQTVDFGDGRFELVPQVSGDTTCTATLYDASNNVLATDSIVMTSRASIIDKIVGTINYIFGCTIYFEY